MAQWYTNADGTMGCRECRVASFRMGTGQCNCPRSTTVAAPQQPGEMERLTAEAEAAGLPGRLDLERLLMARVRSADKVARYYRLRSGKVLERGTVRMGREGPVDADEEKTAQGWDALAEQARNRGDKAAGRLYTLVADRERRADLERRERLAGNLPAARPQSRGSA